MEYNSRESNKFCEEERVHRQQTIYVPEQNRVLERKNKTVMEMAC